MRLAADPRGHFTADFKLNGRSIEAMVDTGATLVAINLSTARRIGISSRRPTSNITVDTANGKTRAASATIDSLQIGRIAVENVEARGARRQGARRHADRHELPEAARRSIEVEDGALLLVQ